MIKQVNSFLGQTKKTRLIRIPLISCLLFYFIFLGLIAPYIIRSQASKELSKLLQRPVQIEKVSINPFCNSISIKNFNILEQDNKEFFHWNEFYINDQYGISNEYYRLFFHRWCNIKLAYNSNYASCWIYNTFTLQLL